MPSVTLLRDLNQYLEPDTGTPSVGRAAAGTYPLLAVETRGADEYVQIGTWICSASGTSVYAVVNGPPPPSILDGIEESFLTDYLQRFRGYSYSLSEPRYTAPLPGVTVKIEPPKQNNCCVFVEDLIVHAFQAAGWAFSWNLTRHNQMMIVYWDDLWSPPRCLGEVDIALGMLEPAETGPLPAPWTVCQGWGTSSGHTFIVVASHAPTGKVLLLESNSAYGLNGPGFRGLGDLDPYLDSGPGRWWEDPDVPTWAAVHAKYPSGIATAQLRVLTSSLVWGAPLP